MFMHIFNKMLIDNLNQQLLLYTPYYPQGQPLSLLEPLQSVYNISEDNFDIVYEKAMYNIFQDATFLAGLMALQENS